MLAPAILCTVYVRALCHFYALHKTELYAEHKIYINLALCGRYAAYASGFLSFFSRETGGRVLWRRFMWHITACKAPRSTRDADGEGGC